MALTQKSVFKNAFFGYYPIISYHFLKPLMGFIALLTLSKIKFKSFIYRVLSVSLHF